MQNCVLKITFAFIIIAIYKNQVFHKIKNGIDYYDKKNRILRDYYNLLRNKIVINKQI